MSAQSPSNVQGFAFKRVFGLLRAGTYVPAPERPHAATSEAGDTPAEASHDVEAETIARQHGLELWPLPGLAPMTRVRTSFGDVPAVALRKGDPVLTRNGDYRRIAWLNRVHLDDHILSSKEDSNPIVIGARALAGRLPAAEIMLSPRQVIAADEGNGLSSDREAAMLLSRAGVRRLRETALSYTMFHVGETAAVCVEGLYLCFPCDA